ncbi:MAG: DNA polymerase domain-containing protein [Candidatus Bathyarchaeia archaeon]
MKSSKQFCNLHNGETVRGWILDLYAGKSDEMVIWLKSEDGRCVRLVDRWSPFLYVSAPSFSALNSLVRYLPKKDFPVRYEFVEKFTGLLDSHRTTVLKLSVPDRFSLRSLAEFVWRLGDYGCYRLWNVDIPILQMYLNDKDLFPLAFVEATVTDDGISWNLMDSAENAEYSVPRFRIAELEVKIDFDSVAPCFDDPISEIKLKMGDESKIIDCSDEGEKIVALVDMVEKWDPDFIVTRGGDSFLFAYLARRALKNEISNFVLDREGTAIHFLHKCGNSYFSYGRVYYRDAPQRLLGRIHLDVENSGTYSHYGLEGLIEVARTCRIPLDRASRLSIGSCMTAIQLYQAVKDDVLVPWKKSEPENFKTAMDLLVADRGGFYFEPEVGIHDNVGEIDFSSMYPMLMLKKNISPETIGCLCCPDSSNRIPELGYNICEKHMGIVPKVLDLMLKKRMYYKAMKKKAIDPEAAMRYEQRQAAYKIILCTCFGYLGYRNARFGKVDAHIAACAFARKTLWDTARLAEQRGFRIVHGIVDSLYLKSKEATDSDFIDLCDEITELMDLPISYEGRYRWIVFLPSKMRFGVPVLNRFYGVFQDGKVKARGIELRRGDTPKIISQCQEAVIQELAKARNSGEFIQLIPYALSIVRKYAEKIMNYEVSFEDVVICKQLSKNPDKYVSNLHQALVARQLQSHGIKIVAGQTVRYVILDADNKRPERRVVAAQLLNESHRYDAKEYFRLLNDAISTILSPFMPNRTAGLNDFLNQIPLN